MTRRLVPLLVVPLLLVTACKCNKDGDGPADAGAVAAGPKQLTEKEPNNSKAEALPLSESSVVTAALSVDPSKPDEDWYTLSSPAARAVDLQLSGIPGADVAMAVHDTDGNLLATVNSQGEGKPERLPNLTVRGNLLVRVWSAKKGAGGAYTLGATFSEPQPGLESEPNDRAVDANVLPLGETASGFVGHSGDEDWYRIELPVAEAPAPTPDPGGSPTTPPPDTGSPPAGEPPPYTGDLPGDSAPPGTQVAAADAGTDADAGATAQAPAAEPPSTALKIGITAVEGVRLELAVLSEAQAQLFSVKSKDGEGLLLRNIGVRGTDRVVYVVVKSAWTGTGKEARRTFNADKPYSLTLSQEEAGATAELEPNDDSGHATPLPLNGYREGFLSPKTDADYYALRAEQPVLAKVQLSGVERLDLVLSVVTLGDGENQPEKTVLRVNDGALKEPEYLNNFFCQGLCWLKVEGASKKLEGKWVRDYENPDIPYRLTIATVPDNGGEEREPDNNGVDGATAVALGRPIRGTVFPRKDLDYYRLDLSGRPVRTPIRAVLTGILKVDVGLYLHRVDESGKLTLVQTSDRGKADASEFIRYSAEPGVYLLEVRDTRNREANFQDPYQLTVEEGE